MSWVAVGSTVLTTGLGLIKGAKQKKEGRQIMESIKGKEVPQAVLDNKRIATQMAYEGMPSEQYALAQKNIDRNNVNAMFQSNNRRGGLGLIPRILQATNDSYLKLDANNAATRNQNKRTLMGVNNTIGEYQNKKFEADYNYGQSLIGAGNENTDNAIDNAIGGLGGGLSDYLRQAKLMGGLGKSTPADRSFRVASVQKPVPMPTGRINTSLALPH